MTVSEIVAEPLRIHNIYGGEGKKRVAELLRTVGLSPEHGNRFPHEFSGGQRQRIGVARALALNPSLIVLDEPVSALDVSIQAQVVNLLASLQNDFGLTYMFIAHDLSVVRHVSDRIAVMYLGKIVEIGRATNLPRADASRTRRRSSRPSRSSRPTSAASGAGSCSRRRAEPANPPSGCRFRTRCWKAQEICAEEEPPLVSHDPARPELLSACPLRRSPAAPRALRGRRACRGTDHHDLAAGGYWPLQLGLVPFERAHLDALTAQARQRRLHGVPLLEVQGTRRLGLLGKASKVSTVEMISSESATRRSARRSRSSFSSLGASALRTSAAAPRTSTAATFMRAIRSSHEEASTIWARPASASFRAETMAVANSAFDGSLPPQAASSSAQKSASMIETGRNTRS
jgi:energy-coupling factor transporter ATP-binding protein EcfA2